MSPASCGMDAGIATILLNRPARKNAFTLAMVDEWARALRTAREDPEVRVVLVTGAGDAFCSGRDSRITRYWFVSVKIVETMRWPNALYSASSTLAAVMDDLDTQHPGIKARLVTEAGALHRFVNVYVNDEDVRFLGALDAKLADGDVVAILPAVAGG